MLDYLCDLAVTVLEGKRIDSKNAPAAVWKREKLFQKALLPRPGSFDRWTIRAWRVLTAEEIMTARPDDSVCAQLKERLHGLIHLEYLELPIKKQQRISQSIHPLVEQGVISKTDSSHKRS